MHKHKRPSWDAYFMMMAEVVKTRSPDIKTQVGSVIVDVEKRVVSTGFNGTPRGFDDSGIDWFGDAKHKYIMHSEANAILFCKVKPAGCTLYTTLSPCVECAKIIKQSGIVAVVYKNEYKNKAGLDLLTEFGIAHERFIDG